MVRMFSTDGSAIVAISASLCGSPLRVIGGAHPGEKGCTLHLRGRRSVELGELERHLDHQPVLLSKVETGDLHDPAEALAERVRVDVQRLGGRAYGSPA